MDVDCDGDQSNPGDGRCGSSEDTQSITAFQYQVAQYAKANGQNVSDLNANSISYVVFGNYGNQPGYVNFHPTKYGVEPLSVMAVVCNGQLVRYVSRHISATIIWTSLIKPVLRRLG